MSKKMLKRSLALGALMAFVITGSAMAREAVDFSKDYPSQIKGGEYGEPYVSDTNAVVIVVTHDDTFDSWYDFKDKPFGLKEKYYPGEQTLDKDVTLTSNVGFTGYINPTDDPNLNINSSYLKTDLNGNKLTIDYQGGVYALSSDGHVSGINYIFTENVGSPYGYVYDHIYTNLKDFKLDLPGFNIYDTKGGGDLEIKTSNVAVLGYGKIDVDELKITSDSNSIQSVLAGANDTDHKMEIAANSIEINAGVKANAIQVHNYLDVRAGKLEIKAKGTEYARAIRVANSTVDGKSLGTAIANIDVEELNISGATEATKVSSNGVLNLSANSGVITNEFYAASTGTIDAKLGAGVEWNGKFVTDDDATKGTLDLSGTWTLKDVAADTMENGKVNTLTEATFRKGSTFVIDGATYEKSTGKYALNGVGKDAKLTVVDGAKLTVEGIDYNTYNIAKGFATVSEDKWDVTNLNTLMEGKWVEDTENKTLQLEVVAKAADQMEAEMGVSSTTAQSLNEVTTAAQNAGVKGDANGTGKEKAVAFVNAMSGVDSKVAGQAFEAVSKMAEAGGNSGTAASIVKNVTGVTNDRLSFNCGHSAPHKGGHGVGLFEEGSGADVWVEYVHGKDEVEDMPSTAGASSYEGQYNGLVMGVDFKKVNKFQSGLAFNYGEGDTNSVGSVARTHSDYDFWGIGYYGSIHNDDSNVIFDIGYAKTDSDVENTSGVGVNFKASPETTTWTAGVKVEKLYQNENVQIVPYTGLRFMSIDPEDYSTECASASYQMERQNVWLLPLGVSIRQEIANDNGWTVSPKVDLSYIWAFGDTDSEMEFSTLGTKTNIGYEVMDDGSFLGLVGIEAHKGQWGFGVSYSYQKGDYSTSKKWFIDANYSF